MAVYPITDIGLKELAEADVVFIGTWVDGLVLFGHRPGRAGRIKRMPVIDGKRVAAFMTYAIHAGKALDRFARVLTERGAVVVARALLRRDHLDQGIDEPGLPGAGHRRRLSDRERALHHPPQHPLGAGPGGRAGGGGRGLRPEGTAT